ncbi:DUF6527 family protein [Raoultella ornithinolytica]|uniref:DUF6527 family protein n=1 Tax=Raoultella ornithinolytica TaxID=54291 RepID=UPI00224803F1|nr:DUF6527 family protein [Raoultella ornithinolytica]MCW9581040.1 DUF6527 family protein [Raoultella ornithinolytica]
MTERVRKASDNRLSFMCPGCGNRHVVQVGNGEGPRWGWNGSVDKPTLTPSVLVTGFMPSDDPEQFDDATKDKPFTCHSFVTDGQIQYLNDCTHSMAGMTVLLPEL